MEKTVEETLREIKTQLRLSMNGMASTCMRQSGLNYKLNFGVELPRIKQIALAFEKDHALAQTLWKEDIRECKILACMLQPADSFFEDIMDIWIDSMPNAEIAQYASMHLFQHLPYAPRKCMSLLSDERPLAQVCAYLTIARLLQQKGDMNGRVQNEFLDQAVTSFLAGDVQVQKAVTTALRVFMRDNEEHKLAVCQFARTYENAADAEAAKFYHWVDSEVNSNFA